MWNLNEQHNACVALRNLFRLINQNRNGAESDKLQRWNAEIPISLLSWNSFSHSRRKQLRIDVQRTLSITCNALQFKDESYTLSPRLYHNGRRARSRMLTAVLPRSFGIPRFLISFLTTSTATTFDIRASTAILSTTEQLRTVVDLHPSSSWSRVVSWRRVSSRVEWWAGNLRRGRAPFRPPSATRFWLCPSPTCPVPSRSRPHRMAPSWSCSADWYLKQREAKVPHAMENRKQSQKKYSRMFFTQKEHPSKKKNLFQQVCEH